MKVEVVDRAKRLRIPLSWCFLGLIFLGWITAILICVVGVFEGNRIQSVLSDISGFALYLPLAALLVFMTILCAFIEPVPAGLRKLVSISSWTLLLGTITTLALAVFTIFSQNRSFVIALEIVGTLTDLFFKAILTLLIFAIRKLLRKSDRVVEVEEKFLEIKVLAQRKTLDVQEAI